MPEFSVVAVSASQGSEEAEIEVITADFDSAGEATGYARRMAEESHRLAAQLDLDFGFSQVAVFQGEVGDPPDFDSAALLGAWLFDEDGVGWTPAGEPEEDAA